MAALEVRSWPVALRQSRLRQQGSQAHQVVGRAGEGEDGGRLGLAAVAQLAQPADRLHPAEGPLDELAPALADGVPGVPRCAPIEGAEALLAGHLRGRAQSAYPDDEAGRVAALVGADAQATASAAALPSQQPQPGLALGGPRGPVSSHSTMRPWRFSVRL